MAKKDKKDTITVIVNGEPIEVEANQNAPIKTLVNKALEQSGNVGQPAENWELTDAQGNPLPLDKKIKDFDFPEDVVLTLNLKAGAGGSYGLSS